MVAQRADLFAAVVGHRIKAKRIELVHIAFVDKPEAMKINGRFVHGFKKGAFSLALLIRPDEVTTISYDLQKKERVLKVQISQGRINSLLCHGKSVIVSDKPLSWSSVRRCLQDFFCPFVQALAASRTGLNGCGVHDRVDAQHHSSTGWLVWRLP